MDGSSTPPLPTSAGSLHDQLRTTQSLLVATVVAALLLGSAVLVFLFRQVVMVRRELDASTALVADYQTNRGPLITNLVARLQGFAQTHPDFNPILERHGIGPAVVAQPSKPSAPSDTRK